MRGDIISYYIALRRNVENFCGPILLLITCPVYGYNQRYNINAYLSQLYVRWRDFSKSVIFHRSL